MEILDLSTNINACNPACMVYGKAWNHWPHVHVCMFQALGSCTSCMKLYASLTIYCCFTVHVLLVCVCLCMQGDPGHTNEPQGNAKCRLLPVDSSPVPCRHAGWLGTESRPAQFPGTAASCHQRWPNNDHTCLIHHMGWLNESKAHNTKTLTH